MDEDQIPAIDEIFDNIEYGLEDAFELAFEMKDIMNK